MKYLQKVVGVNEGRSNVFKTDHCVMCSHIFKKIRNCEICRMRRPRLFQPRLELTADQKILNIESESRSHHRNALIAQAFFLFNSKLSRENKNRVDNVRSLQRLCLPQPRLDGSSQTVRCQQSVRRCGLDTRRFYTSSPLDDWFLLREQPAESKKMARQQRCSKVECWNETVECCFFFAPCARHQGSQNKQLIITTHCLLCWFCNTVWCINHVQNQSTQTTKLERISFVPKCFVES